MKVKRECVVCGAPFVGDPRRRYCGDRCKAKKKTELRQERTCLDCGKPVASATRCRSCRHQHLQSKGTNQKVRATPYEERRAASVLTLRSRLGLP